MKNKYPKLICAFAAAVLCFTGGMLAAEPRSASAAETSGNWGKNNITLKNVTSSIEIKNIVSNPVTYKDNAENGTLVSASETVNASVMTGSQTVIFTAAYPYTTTKRTGDYTEYSIVSAERIYRFRDDYFKYFADCVRLSVRTEIFRARTHRRQRERLKYESMC